MARNHDSFREVQRFPLRRTAAALAGPPLLLLAVVVWQVALGHDMGKYALPNKSLIGWTVFLWLLFFRLITVSMVTSVRDGQLIVTLRGLWRTRRVALSEISSVENVTFDPARDYGGYSIRSIPNGTAYIAKGSHGVRATLKNGSIIVVGSQSAPKLALALKILETP